MKPGIAAGALGGVLVGLTLLGVEEAANAAVGISPLLAAEWLQVLPLYVLPAALIGLVAGAFRRPGELHALAGLSAVLVGSKLAARGLPVLPVLGASLVLGLLAAEGVFRLGSRSRRLVPATVALGSVFVPAFLALNHNYLGSPTSAEAMKVDLLLLGLGVVAALLAGGLRLLPSVAVAAIGGPALVGAVVAGLSHRPDPTPAPANGKPDVVVIVIDTLRADRLGPWGNERGLTPNLDALAARGTVFLDATSPAPWTLPSFGSLLTGRLPYAHGAGTNPGDNNTHAPLDPTVPTLAAAMTDGGYRTGALVTNGYIKRYFGLDRGFDLYDDALGLAHELSMPTPYDQLGLTILQDRYYRRASRMADAGIDWWAATEGGPRFLLLHFMDVHKPYLPDPDDLERLAGRRAPDNVRPSDPDAYDAELIGIDRELARFLAVLGPDTIVVLTSDHGETFDEHPGAYPQDAVEAHVVHGQNLYQELLHVPLLVVGPGVPAGQRVTRPVASFDLVPTVLQLAGQPPLAALDAEPLVEALGGAAASTERAIRSQAILYGTEKRAVRVGADKLIETRWGRELYDLQNDPGEARDRSVAEAARVEALLPLLPAQSTAAAQQVPDDLKKQLEALGYLE